MRAALLEKHSQPLTFVDDIDVEDPREGEVQVQVSHCGICHSDLTIVDMPAGEMLARYWATRRRGPSSRSVPASRVFPRATG